MVPIVVELASRLGDSAPSTKDVWRASDRDKLDRAKHLDVLPIRMPSNLTFTIKGDPQLYDAFATYVDCLRGSVSILRAKSRG